MTKRFAVGAACILLMALVIPLIQHEVLGGREEAAEVDEALFEQGEQLYEGECAMCHQADGAGNPPAFPALRDNERLEDLELIVSNIHLGEGAMPAFPGLEAAEIAALATYIRNAWDNEFGDVSTEDVFSILDEVAVAFEAVSIWDGVYTTEQAERGRTIFHQCSICHGPRGQGGIDEDMPIGPALARGSFLRSWNGRNVAALYEFTRATMPQQNPGFLSEQEYIDLIAYMFELSGVPAGEEELEPDPELLTQILIRLAADDNDGQPEEGN